MTLLPPRRITRVLIANRGEIARRVIRTCHAMGLETVAVYSDVDEHAPHVGEATYAESIGSPTAYLSIDAILAAVKRSGADSVHPGYGFLSENPAFVAALEAAGVTHIGPSSHSIQQLGSKTVAKELAARANVSVAPTLLLQDSEIDLRVAKLEEFAVRVGYPVIIKAAAGGGGRGMRLVSAPGDCRAELDSASREAQKAFGSSEVFVEKYIAPARHIEVQIAADLHGHCIALGTRDCSLQRSNQKIIEEAPAVALKPGVSEELCEAACRLAKEACYSNLGTVEFLYTSDGLFYFLEVNTRLQVEHPVTEMVTGLDLVEIQLRIARGEALQTILGDTSPPASRGHAIEARWCAEEYTGRFVSATGVILDRFIPTNSTYEGTIRADMGYEVCSEVSHYYDSLLGKLIVHAPDRDKAIRLLNDVLERSRISGVATNRSLLKHLLVTPAFRSHTHTIQGTQSLLPSESEIRSLRVQAHAIVAATRMFEPLSPWVSGSPWMQTQSLGVDGIQYPLTTRIQGEVHSSYTTFVTSSGVRTVHVDISGATVAKLSVAILESTLISKYQQRSVVSLDSGQPLTVDLVRLGDTTWVHTSNISLAVCTTILRRAATGAEAKSSESGITSPIPGKVVALNVKEGDLVQEGAILLVLDSMKMEHPFRASRSGKVASLSVSLGSIVQAGAGLLVID